MEIVVAWVIRLVIERVSRMAIFARRDSWMSARSARFTNIECRRSNLRQQGFTLIELVTVLILLGIVSLAVMPRMTNLASFAARGYVDQAQAALRHAQKTAIAQRRWVAVTDQANGLSLAACRSGASGDGCAPAATPVCDLPVIDPGTGQAFSITAPAGVSLGHNAAYSGQFLFDCEGRPRSVSGSVVYTVSGDLNLSFTVEAETGYVH
jgi:MSHA pilin protein MshC